MATSLQPEEVTRIAEEIQGRFIEEFKNDNEKIDHRDYKRVKTSLPYVSKFVQQKMGDMEEAYEMLVGTQKWRKTSGVQDLSFDKIDQSYFETGVGIPHGDDRDGSSIVILNCHLHKKDAKKFPQLQQFFIFCLETHARRFPDKKMTLLFNMSQCGISNMDMEFVKFKINCFKLYFPNMLNYLLVFEMPWVLQAAWRIIKGWLGEAAIRKIKFVTKSDITEYVSPDQLLIQFGGTDTWTYQYNQGELKAQADEVWGHDPLIIEDNDTDNDEDDVEESIKQVRFAPGQPPSRQSRYGSQEEDIDAPSRSLDSQIRKGTAISPGYRRRQVNKLMSSQKQSSDSQLMSLPPIIEDNKRLSYQQQQQQSSNCILQISPIEELLFKGPEIHELLCNVVLTNTTTSIVAYKIKTTAPNRYKVRPNINLVEGGEDAHIQVKLLSGSSELVLQDKFLVQAYQFNSLTQPPDASQLPIFWKTLGRDKNVEEYRLKCRYVHEVPQSLDRQHQDGSSLLVLQNKVDRLVATVTKLQNTVDRLSMLCIVLFLIIMITNIIILSFL